MIATPRLILRPLDAGDAPFMLALLNDADFIANIADRGVRDEAGAARYIAEGPAAMRAAHGHAMDAVVDRETGRPVGVCGLIRRDFLPAPDLGYAFLPEGRGRGFALEAGRAALADGRDRLGIGHVLAIVNPDNARSIVVLMKLGFLGTRMITLPDGKTVRLMAVDV